MKEIPRPTTAPSGSRSSSELHAIANTDLKLYGACFVQSRGYSQTDRMEGWRAEIDEYANALGCTDVQCVDLSRKIVGKVIKKEGKSYIGTVSAYVEFQLVNGQCEIHYKRWDKMTESTTAPITPPAQEYTKIHQINGTPIKPDTAMKPVEIITTWSNKGRLHQVE